MYRVVREMLPQQHYGPQELLRLLETEQTRNQRAGRSHAKRHAALPHPTLIRRFNTGAASRKVGMASLRFSASGSLPSATAALVCRREGAGLGRRFRWITAQPDVAPAASDGYALYPRLRARIAGI